MKKSITISDYTLQLTYSDDILIEEDSFPYSVMKYLMGYNWWQISHNRCVCYIQQNLHNQYFTSKLAYLIIFGWQHYPAQFYQKVSAKIPTGDIQRFRFYAGTTELCALKDHQPSDL